MEPGLALDFATEIGTPPDAQCLSQIQHIRGEVFINKGLHEFPA
jgi:hypothetical protein